MGFMPQYRILLVKCSLAVQSNHQPSVIGSVEPIDYERSMGYEDLSILALGVTPVELAL